MIRYGLAYYKQHPEMYLSDKLPSFSIPNLGDDYINCYRFDLYDTCFDTWNSFEIIKGAI